MLQRFDSRKYLQEDSAIYSKLAPRASGVLKNYKFNRVGAPLLAGPRKTRHYWPLCLRKTRSDMKKNPVSGNFWSRNVYEL